jgi:hypothetical protein
MAKTSVAVRTSGTTAANPAAEVVASATVTLRLTEIDISTAGAGGGTFGIGFPAAVGISPSATANIQNHRAADQGATGSISTAWAGGTPPTVPANFLYRITVPAATGSVVSVVIPEGIEIPPNKSIVLWNITNTDVMDVTFIVSITPAAQILSGLI